MKGIWAIVWKDIVTELRTRELILSMFTFSLLITVIFNFAFDLSVDLISLGIPAILWIAFTLAGVLGLSRSFAIEKEGNTIFGLLLSPLDRSFIFFGKVIGNTVFVLITELITLPLFMLFFNLGFGSYLIPLLLIVFLGTVGFVSVGTLFSAIALNTRLREVLFPILFFPVIVPVIISSVKLSRTVFEGKSIAEAGSALGILISFDVLFLVVCAVVFEYVLEE